MILLLLKNIIPTQEKSSSDLQRLAILEHKFEILININIVKRIMFPTLKEIVMEEYLPDITYDDVLNQS